MAKRTNQDRIQELMDVCNKLREEWDPEEAGGFFIIINAEQTAKHIAAINGKELILALTAIMQNKEHGPFLRTAIKYSLIDAL